MTQRYLVTGSHGVGKTTLIEAWLKNSTKPIVAIPETARIVAAEGYKVSAEMNEAGFRRHLSIQLAALNRGSGNLVVFDRGLFDVAIYTADYPEHQLNPDYQTILQELVTLEESQLTGYIYVPIEFPLQADGLRPADLHYQQLIDTRIKQRLEKSSKPIIQVTGSITERLAQIQRIVQ